MFLPDEPRLVPLRSPRRRAPHLDPEHLTAEALETSYVDFREIVVLDAVPNDISVVSGIITEEFSTPLSQSGGMIMRSISVIATEV